MTETQLKPRAGSARPRLTVSELVTLADTLSFEALMTRCGLDLTDASVYPLWDELAAASDALERALAALKRARAIEVQA